MASGDRRPRRATIHDVAAASGVSHGTVSRVLNAERYFSDEARIAVENAVAQVGYVRNTAARNLKTQRSHAVGLIVHEPHSLFLEDPNIGAILLGTNEILSAADYQLVSLVIDSDRDSDRVAEYLRGGFVDGVIIISARSLPYRSVNSDRKFSHCRRLSTMAPATAFAKLSSTAPRAVVGSLVLPVAGSIRPRSLLRAAWVTRCTHSPTPGTWSLNA